MGKKDKPVEKEEVAALQDAGVKKKKKKKNDKLEAAAEAAVTSDKPKLSKEEKAAKKAAKEAKVGAMRESPRLAAAKAAEVVPEASLDADEEDSSFKVHKYVPPPEPEDETLQCRDCGADFIFTIGEQEFFKQKGFDNKKTRCADCTAAKKARFGDGGGKGDGGKGKGGKGKGGGKGGGFACYNCGEEGHRSSDCSKPSSGGKGGGKGGGGGICFAFQKGECSRGDSCRFAHS